MKKKTIVLYYSRKGSNKYLAEKISNELSCPIEAIRPRLNAFLLLLMKIHFGIKPLKHNLTDYDSVILCGPIWMGKLIPPLRSFITKNKGALKELIFVSCCGSTDAKKYEKFGHGLVFREVENLLKDRCIFCQAFPISLVLPVEQKEDPGAFMKAHLNDDNFKGEIQDVFDDFIRKVNEASGKLS